MHELGIVFYIIRDVKKAALENAVEHVSAVVMNIGEVSTVVPELLTDCWRWAADKEPLLKGCVLKVNTIPALTHCDGCGEEFRNDRGHFADVHHHGGNMLHGVLESRLLDVPDDVEYDA